MASARAGAADGVDAGCRRGRATTVPPPAAPQEDQDRLLSTFKRRTLSRVAKAASAARKSQRQERKRAESERKRFQHVDTEAFLRETRTRVLERQIAGCQLEPGTRPARVAVVGGGPVGLWIASLLAREYATAPVNGTGGLCVSRLGPGPTVDVFERRRDDGSGERRIVLAISATTQEHINRHILPPPHGDRHHLSPTCSIAYLEDLLRDNFRRFAAAGFGKLHFDREINDPEVLLAEGYDVVIVASGRRALDDTWRAAHDMQVSVSNAGEALILKYTLAGPCDPGLVPSAEFALARIVGGGRVFLRPGASESQGWAWFVGLPAAVATQFRRVLDRYGGRATFDSFGDTWNVLQSGAGVGGALEGKSDWPAAAIKLLDEMLMPDEVSARMVEASFWHSEQVMYRSGDGWLVLAGDAACGRPFYLGSTLNGHLADALSLARGPPWSQWDPEGGPFRKYLERYRLRTSARGFARHARAAQAGEESDGGSPVTPRDHARRTHSGERRWSGARRRVSSAGLQRHA